VSGGWRNGALPDDRGIVYLRSHSDGTRSVLICCGVEGGRPVHVFAIHTRRASVEIDPAIEWVAADAANRYTTGMVIVSATGGGTVSIRKPPPGAGPLLDLLEE
jgi:hypothetical protein